MSSIFETIDTHVSRRKNTLIDNQVRKSIFMNNDSNLNTLPLIPSDISTNNQVVLEITNSSLSVVHTKFVFSSFYIIEFSWWCSVICLLIPFISNIYNTAIDPHTDDSELHRLPYNCNIFYLGLFFTLPTTSVYLFCISLYYCRYSISAVVMSISSVFIFVLSIEHSCMIGVIKNDNNVIFYAFSFSLILGIYSQYVFFSKSQQTSAVYMCYVAVNCIAICCIVFSTTIVIVLSIISQELNYKIVLYTRIIPGVSALCIHIFSTHFTLFVVYKTAEIILP